jgi:hypothetical protein
MTLEERIIKVLYPFRAWLSPGKKCRLACEYTGEAAAALIRGKLVSDSPCMIGRFGATELAGMMCVRDIESTLPLWLKYWKVFRGEMRTAGKWNRRIRQHMADWSGFFPVTDDALTRFTRLMEEDARCLDVLGSWLAEEVRIRTLFEKATIIPIDIILFPYLQDDLWTQALAGKKVLVIHPFEDSIKKQYAKRHLLFDGKTVLPDFELMTLKAVQSLRGEMDQFVSWFDALAWMCQQVDRMDFDVALIGAGAYGFPLAAHIKRSGRKAVHVGGGLQLWFGIMGKRWEEDANLKPYVNEHWVRPNENETPRDLKTLESGWCYW